MNRHFHIVFLAFLTDFRTVIFPAIHIIFTIMKELSKFSYSLIHSIINTSIIKHKIRKKSVISIKTVFALLCRAGWELLLVLCFYFVEFLLEELVAA